MRACLAFFRMRLVNGLQYRTAAYAGIFTQFFWGFMEIQLYGAFYREKINKWEERLNGRQRNYGERNL